MTDRRLRLLTLLMVFSMLLLLMPTASAEEHDPEKRVLIALAYSEKMSQEAMELMKQAALEMGTELLQKEDCEVAILDTGSGLSFSGFGEDRESLQAFMSLQRGRSEMPMQEILQESMLRLQEETETADKRVLLLCGVREDYSVYGDVMVYPLDVYTFLNQAESTEKRTAAERLSALGEDYKEIRELSEMREVSPEPPPEEPTADKTYGEVNLDAPFSQVLLFDGEASLLAVVNNQELTVFREGGSRLKLTEKGRLTLPLRESESRQLQFAAVEKGEVFFRLLASDMIWVAATEAEKGDVFLASFSAETPPVLTRGEEEIPMLSVDAEDLQSKLQVDADTTQGAASVKSMSVPIYYGSIVWYIAEPLDGYRFEGWYLGNALFSTEQELAVRVTGDLRLEARFLPVSTETEPEEPLEEQKTEDTQRQEPKPWHAECLIWIVAGLCILTLAPVVFIMVKWWRATQTNGVRKGPGLLVNSGSQKGKCFTCRANQLVIVGTGAKDCEIVLSREYEYVSRCHMSLRYDNATHCYVVTDTSTNGVYLTNRHRLPKGRPISLPPSTELLLANVDCSVTLL